MGYRSDVAYKIKFGSSEMMGLFLAEAKAKEETRLVFEDMDEEGLDANGKVIISEESKCITFHAHSWKWYDDFEIVKAHEALIQQAREYSEDEDDRGVEYGFCRIGEDIDDISQESSAEGYDLVWVSRQILFDDD